VPSARYHHHVTVDAAPEDLWSAMQEPAAWIGVGPIEHVHDPSFSEEGYLERYYWDATIAGRGWDGTATTRHADPGRTMEIHLDSSEMTAIVTAELTPCEAGTEMEVAIRARTKGMLSGLFWGVIDQTIRSSMKSQVERFAERLVARRS